MSSRLFVHLPVVLLTLTILGACESTPATPMATSSLLPTRPLATATAMPTLTPSLAVPPTLVPTTAVPPTPTANLFASVVGIVDANNTAYPRQVKANNGTVTIRAKPVRIHTLSLGYDEIAYALVPSDRVVAVGRATQDPVQSNVSELAKAATGIGREPEAIIAQRPDIVIASPSSRADLVTALQNAGITVVQVGVDNSPQKRVENILLLGYILGEEQRALKLANEVQVRVDALNALIAPKPASVKTRVLSLTSFSNQTFTAGTASTEGNIIEAAGGINVAAEAGLQRNPTTSLEGIISMRPDLIFIPQPPDSGEPFRQSLLKNEALKDVPAIKSGKVFVVDTKQFTTLSFWNVRGTEELAKMLWPQDWGGKTFPPFSFPT